MQSLKMRVLKRGVLDRVHFSLCRWVIGFARTRSIAHSADHTMLIVPFAAACVRVAGKFSLDLCSAIALPCARDAPLTILAADC